MDIPLTQIAVFRADGNAVPASNSDARASTDTRYARSGLSGELRSMTRRPSAGSGDVLEAIMGSGNWVPRGDPRPIAHTNHSEHQ